MFHGVIIRDCETGDVVASNSTKFERGKVVDVYRRVVLYSNAAVYTLTRYVRGRSAREQQYIVEVEDTVKGQMLVLACFKEDIVSNKKSVLANLRRMTELCGCGDGVTVYRIYGYKTYEFKPEEGKFKEVF